MKSCIAYIKETFARNSEQIPIGKLPEWVVPESYDLDFKIDPAQKGYTGKTTIHL
ncbi:hypothetical protein, partial [Acinetobacter baumannii]|uniref:hypothetical protein n=1 Tax=Acinetobacter baumannii TaxID=470 RepID=UPI00387EB7CF